MVNLFLLSALLGYVVVPASPFKSSVATTLPRFPSPLLDVGRDARPERRVKFPDAARQSWFEQLPTRSRRQTSCSITELAQRLVAIQCDNDYLRAMRETESAECSYLLTYRQITGRVGSRDFPDCGTDDNGILCAAHDVSDVSPLFMAQNVIEECLNNIDSRACSEECILTLQNFSNRFGCCIHSIDILQSSDYIRALTPQLWEDCGVALPAPCNNAPPRLPPLNINASCSYTCTFTQVDALFCKYQAAETVQILQECGDEQSARAVSQLCGFNDRGDFCPTIGDVDIASFTFPANELNEEYVFELYDKCSLFSATGYCPAECREALIEAKEKFGCCFNNINKTAFGELLSSAEEGGIHEFLTSYELWAACVLEPPSFCQLSNDTQAYDDLTQCSICEVSKLQSGEFLLEVVMGAVVFVAIILMIAITILIMYCYFWKRHSNTKKVPHTTHNPPVLPVLPVPPLPQVDHDTIMLQGNEDVNSIHYYEYIPPLPVLPEPSLDSNQPQEAHPKDGNENMMTNATYDHLLPRNQQQRATTPILHNSARTSNPTPPPLPPDPPMDEGMGMLQAGEDIGDIAMANNPANNSLRSTFGGSSEVVVMYI